MAASALSTKEKYRIFFNINILKALIVSHEKLYNSTNWYQHYWNILTMGF